MSREKFFNKYSLEKMVVEAINIYNRYRSPEATAELLEYSDGCIKVVFHGSFCNTCGVRDWVEDFKYVLEDIGIDNDLAEYIEPGGDSDIRIGVFKIRFRSDRV